MSTEKHLWEAEHPYYCREGNYLHSPLSSPDIEPHMTFASWEEFYDFATNSAFRDPDLNLVYRWDWRVPNPDDYEEGEELPSDKLMLYVVQQRRAFNLSFQVNISRQDEEAINSWLTERAKTVRSIWAPLLDKALQDL